MPLGPYVLPCPLTPLRAAKSPHPTPARDTSNALAKDTNEDALAAISNLRASAGMAVGIQVGPARRSPACLGGEKTRPDFLTGIKKPVCLPRAATLSRDSGFRPDPPLPFLSSPTPSGAPSHLPSPSFPSWFPSATAHNMAGSSYTHVSQPGGPETACYVHTAASGGANAASLDGSICLHVDHPATPSYARVT